ncbi:S8 family serine peptidase [Tuwongella immobilis]|uniref:P/Homo B domain-containing protein n=1 Tax=Tuwongella immobilis TaxID=692036 RepID=A0A6C2YT95_9BACT|nr:S8 family serine peptidase [Tuwongella immobilis]VIP04557.1 peptidase s8 and s53 subtilisin kexin sedolisin : Peptidase S8 and S53 subtilisin kexin sedolisin OS=Isosphaera pallida (strain ATCC 43644 / DSM 9630 / IS1B) GN=Isop_1073 PE=4 SV=1: Peptidase_S8: P_proprotein: P_proprotein: He_PIG [Tuwongella immobilis]VTS06475.1 peptidase s8 and s53 subtilisin kexin sedolisin : Peptidase S8 and S53 subtilisin kexin sedolisin OS=Isosphaera pallida (strain ATCC 43644 / DSM 9630 / IS1B) GN=Isop_1073 PE=
MKPKWLDSTHELESRIAPSLTTVEWQGESISTTEIVIAVDSGFFSSASGPGRELAALQRTPSALANSVVQQTRLVSVASGGQQEIVKVELAAGISPIAAMEAYANLPGVAWVAPNRVVTVSPTYTPNDPSYSSQYSHTKMQTNLAWDLFPNIASTSPGDSNLVVAIIDSGMLLTHEDLAAHLWVNAGEVAGNGVDDDGNGFIDDRNGWDFLDGDNNPQAASTGDNDHATHVAGIIGAAMNNNKGGTGVAPGVKLMPLRLLLGGPTSLTSLQVANAFYYAAKNGAKIINNSWTVGNFSADAVVITAVNSAYDSGALILNAAGNANAFATNSENYAQMLTVASTTSTDARSGFSNYGPGVDISAPGSDVYSSVADGGYANFSGTSMATPNAAGLAALIWSKNPTWTRDQVAAQLVGTADNIDAVNSGFIGNLGTGRVNSLAALTETLAAPQFGTLTLPAEGSVVTKLATTFRLDLESVFDPNLLAPGSLVLRNAGLDATFGTSDDVEVPLTITPQGGRFGVGTNWLSFTIAGDLLTGFYEFRGRANTISNPFGTALDGNGDGTAGDDFVRRFRLFQQISGSVFEDLNQNGKRDAGEPGIAGTLVHIDSNANGVIDRVEVAWPGPTTPITAGGTKTFTTVVSGQTLPVNDLNVLISMTHTFIGDVTIQLTSPQGTTVTLFRRRGGGGDNLTNTWFDDRAGSAISFGTAPFTGSFRPESALAAFNGEDPNGTWTLSIDDLFTSDTGSLVNWQLSFESEFAQVTDSNGAYQFNGVPVGNQTLTTTLPNGMVSFAPSDGKATIAVASLTDEYRQNFAAIAIPSISGQMFHDRNGDGTRQANEELLDVAAPFVDLDANGQRQSIVQSINPNLAIPDDRSNVESSISVGASGFVDTIELTLTIPHTYIGDLRISLISPTGTEVRLITERDNPADGYDNLVLADDADVSIQNSPNSGIITGRFRPAGSLATFLGETITGNWTLRISDQGVQDIGTLTSWSIRFFERRARIVTPGTYVFERLQPRTYPSTIQQPGYRIVTPVSGSFSTTIASATDQNPGQHFGLAKVDAVYGRLFADIDSDQIPDVGEPGLSGWTVFIDRDSDGKLTVGEEQTTTDSDGQYLFEGLTAGSFTIRAVQQVGWAPSIATVGVTLATGATLFERNLAFTADPTPPTASIVAVTPNPRATGLDSMQILFSEGITGFDLGDLSLTRDGGTNLLTGTESLSRISGNLWEISGLSALTSTPGDYQLTLSATGSGILDGALNPLLGDAAGGFYVNGNPVITPIGTQTAFEESETRFTVLADDGNPGDDPLQFSLGAGAPSGAAIDPTTGEFTWTPDESQGPGNFSVTVIVTNANFPTLQSSVTFAIDVMEVNQPPVLDPIADQTMDENTTLTFTISATDLDLPGNTLTFSLASANPANASIDPVTGEFTFAPVEEQLPGVYEFTVQVTDAGNLADLRIFTVTINPINDDPTFVALSTVVVPEDSGPVSLPGFASNLSAGPADEAGQLLTFEITSNSNPGLFVGSVTVDPAGTLQFTPTPLANGTATLTLILRDDAGGISSMHSFTITVTPVNSSPMFVIGPSLTVSDSAAVSVPNWATAIVGGPPDEIGQAVTFRLESISDVSLFAVLPSVDSSGTLTFTPQTNANGTAIVTFVLVDEFGAESLPQTVEITIVDRTAPTVVISQMDDSLTLPGLVQYTLTFSTPVTGVTPAALTLTPARVGAEIVAITGEGSEYIVTVRTGSLQGAIALGIVADSGIVDAVGNPLAGGLIGPSYEIVATGMQVVGAASGPGAIRVYSTTGELMFEQTVFEGDFTGGVRVATGDITGDGIDDILTAAGPGGGPRIRLIDGATRQVIRDAFVFEPTFTGGVYIAAGDLNGDGIAEVIVSAGELGGPRVIAWDGKTGAQLFDFFAFTATDRSGVTIAVGDLLGTGRNQLIAGQSMGGSQVRVFDERATLLHSFLAYEPTFTGGVFVAIAENKLLTLPGQGGAPRLREFDFVDDAFVVTRDEFIASDSARYGATISAFEDDHGAGLFIGLGDGTLMQMDGTGEVTSESPFGPDYVGGIWVG